MCVRVSVITAECVHPDRGQRYNLYYCKSPAKYSNSSIFTLIGDILKMGCGGGSQIREEPVGVLVCVMFTWNNIVSVYEGPPLN